MTAAAEAMVAFFDRPGNGALALTALVAICGWVFHVWAERSTRAPVVPTATDARPARLADGTLEPAAVVGLLTNAYDVPPSAITATALDLAARGWIRFSLLDGELVVVTKAEATAGDSLRPFEQQVLNHLASRAFNDIISAGTLAASRGRLDRRWHRRFARSVVATATGQGLCTRRYTAAHIAPAAAAATIGLIVAWRSARGGEAIAIGDSWRARGVWLLAIGALGALGWHTLQRGLGSAQRPTELGAERAAAWLGFRRRLRDRIPANASVIGTAPQQEALAQAVVMGVADQVAGELPVAPPGHHLAWSDAGGVPHVVRVAYPIRPGYGQHPVKVLAAGAAVFLVARWVQGFLRRIGDGESLQSLIERMPGQVALVETIADVLALICWLPIAWSAWAIVAGAIDSVATRERIGSVVRARRPREVVNASVLGIVKPFAERDRFTTYIAVDDGTRVRLTAWLASERNSAPQGAHARVRATPLLGYVRSSEPVGAATRT